MLRARSEARRSLIYATATLDRQSHIEQSSAVSTGTFSRIDTLCKVALTRLIGFVDIIREIATPRSTPIIISIATIGTACKGYVVYDNSIAGNESAVGMGHADCRGCYGYHEESDYSQESACGDLRDRLTLVPCDVIVAGLGANAT